MFNTLLSGTEKVQLITDNCHLSLWKTEMKRIEYVRRNPTCWKYSQVERMRGTHPLYVCFASQWTSTVQPKKMVGLSYSAFNGLLSGVLSAHHFGVATKKDTKTVAHECKFEFISFRLNMKLTDKSVIFFIWWSFYGRLWSTACS